jgi:hypothetical protein
LNIIAPEFNKLNDFNLLTAELRDSATFLLLGLIVIHGPMPNVYEV